MTFVFQVVRFKKNCVMRILLPLLAFFIFSIPSFGFQAESPDPVLYLAFDESITDSTGLNTNIQVMGGEFVEDRNGNPNSAYYFNGIDDVITIINPALKINEITDEKGITFMAWINIEGFETSSRAIILERYDIYNGDYWKSEGYHFGVNNVGQLHARSANSGYIDKLYERNTWIHIAVTIQNGMGAYFVDGVKYSTATHLRSATNSDISIGNTAFSNQSFKGKLDEIKLYDTVLSDSLIAKAAGLEPIEEVDEEILHLSFDGVIVDSSKYQSFKDTTQNIDRFVTDRFGNPNSAFNFKGYEYDIRISNGNFYSNFSKRKSYSISSWVYIDSYRNSVLLQIPYSADSGKPGFTLNLDVDGNISFTTGRDGILKLNSPFPQNRWVHLAFTFDGEERSIYINGKKQNNISNLLTTWPINIKGVTGALIIGNNSYDNIPYEGILDDLIIYNYALSEEEVIQLVDYSEEIKPVPDTKLLLFPFDSSYEDEGDLNNKTVSSGGVFIKDRFDQDNNSILFDENDYLTIEDSDNRLDSIGNKLTFGTWIKPRDLGEVSESILFERSDGTNGDRIKSWIYSDYAPENAFYFSINSESVYFRSLDIIENNWVFLTATYDGQQVKLFLNGELKAIKKLETESFVTESDLYIAGKPGYGKYEKGYDGALDDLFLYNYVLSDSAIAQIYDLNKEGRKYPPKLLVNLDLKDSLVISNHGSEIELSEIEADKGRFEESGGALKFGDESDYIRIVNTGENLDSLYSGITLNAWVKLADYSEEPMSIIDRNSSGDKGFYLGIVNKEFIFKINNASIPSRFYPSRGKWYLLTGTLENTEMRLFIDGELTYKGEYSGKMEVSDTDIFIGNNQDLSNPFIGLIDEIQIYNYALSDSSIRELYSDRFHGYNSVDSKILDIGFDNSIEDMSGAGQTLQVNGGTFISDRLSQTESAYYFDGDDITVVDTDNGFDSLSNSLTISSWVIMGTRDGVYPKSNLISRIDTEFDKYSISIQESPQPSYQYPDSKELFFQIDDVSISHKDFTIKPGYWFHFAATYSDNLMKLYLNGVKVSEKFYDGLITVSESDLLIGNSQDGSEPFKGVLDEIQIYNYALSDSAIADMIDIEVLPVALEVENEVPSSVILNQNYPNPFNPTTSISFYLPKTDLANLKVYDLLGREVAVLINQTLPSGEHTYHLNASGFSTGVYFYRLSTGNAVITKKMLLIK